MSTDPHINNLIQVGSRKSQLALTQTKSIIQQLQERHPKTSYEIISITTIGDKILDTALSKIGEKSLFTKELEHGLASKHFDFIVHSLKDLPTTLPDGMIVSTITKRENPADVVVMHKNHQHFTLNDLPEGSIIGTSSLRRSAQLKKNFPHLKFKDVRGNLNTRLSKLDNHDTYQALVLAAAGVIRMGWSHRISQILTPDECLYAAGQGALGLECRESDLHTIKYLSELSDESTLLCCIAERSFLRKLEGGCSAPVGVNSCLNEDDELELTGAVFSLDGSKWIRESEKVCMEEVIRPNKRGKFSQKTYCGIVSNVISDFKMSTAEKLGISLAEELIKLGAEVILREAKAESQKDINAAPRKNISENVNQTIVSAN